VTLTVHLLCPRPNSKACENFEGCCGFSYVYTADIDGVPLGRCMAKVSGG